MRTIVISDAHGQPQLIQNALDHAGFQWSKDRLIYAGDLLDIGDEASECLRILEREDAEILFGNHEYAIVLRLHVTPQNQSSWGFRKLILDRFFAGEWRLVAEADGVIISHAGISQVYQQMWNRIFSGVEADFVDYVNHRFDGVTRASLAEMALDGDSRGGCIGSAMNEFEDDDSPLWFRPGFLRPLPGVVQVSGHTPIETLTDRSGLEDFHMIDPYTRALETGEQVMARYKYAVIEDGIVTVHDSLVDSMVG